MRVFISWSGEPSRSVAQALRDWLPIVVQHVEPWMSDEDIESGGRWNDQIAAELEAAAFEIICLTSSNLNRPWLLFEAGALAKRFNAARVVPLLIDLKPADVAMPLASFQGRPLSQDGMLRLVTDMNAAREQPLPDQKIGQLFRAMWPVLEAQVADAKVPSVFEEGGQPVRLKTFLGNSWRRCDVSSGGWKCPIRRDFASS
jgi:TIR domain